MENNIKDVKKYKEFLEKLNLKFQNKNVGDYTLQVHVQESFMEQQECISSP